MPRSRDSNELSRPARRLDNAASRVVERYLAHFAGRDWDVMSGCWSTTFGPTIVAVW